MSFVGAIDSETNIAAWNKAVTSLAAFSEVIRFEITSLDIILSAVNTSKTVLGKTQFNQTCFHEYSLNFTNSVEEGFDGKSYSFVVSSRPLLILFKHLDGSDLQYICFKAIWLKDCPVQLNSKLLIEIKTKKLIVKKYQTGFTPSVPDDSSRLEDFRYELRRQEENESGESKVKHLKLEIHTVKQFLDMVSLGCEDFKLEKEANKLNLSGYTEQIMKDREYLKQPMYASISLNLDDIVDSNLELFENGNVHMSMKEFKNFVSLVSGISEYRKLYDKNGTDSGTYSGTYSGTKESQYFDVFFMNASNPIVFSFEKSDVKVSYELIIGGDGAYAQEGNHKFFFQGIHILEKKEEPYSNKRSKNGGSGSLDLTKSIITKSGKSYDAVDRLFLPEDDLQTQEPTLKRTRYDEMSNADTDLGDDSSEENEDNEKWLGPTQGVTVPRSIFDDPEGGL